MQGYPWLHSCPSGQHGAHEGSRLHGEISWGVHVCIRMSVWGETEERKRQCWLEGVQVHKRHRREQSLELAGAREPRGRGLAEWTEMKTDLEEQQKVPSCAVCGLK